MTTERKDPEALAREIAEERAERGLIVAPHADPSAVVLWGTNDPAGMVARMTMVADAMAGAVRARGMANQIDGREYVRAEGWALVGAMIGIFPRTVALDEIREGDALVGFRATTELVTAAGAVVGGAVALCTVSESKWADRDWNQLVSMAQTRANAKAYRQSLGFIMPMAGYAPTPAEEMDGIGREDSAPRAPRGGRRPVEATARDAAPKQNGVTEPAAVKDVGSLVQWARFHYGLQPAEVAAALGVEKVPDIRGAVGDAWADAQAAVRSACGPEPSAAAVAAEAEDLPF